MIGKVPLAAFTGFNCTYCNVVLNSLDQLTAHREGESQSITGESDGTSFNVQLFFLNLLQNTF